MPRSFEVVIAALMEFDMPHAKGEVSVVIDGDMREEERKRCEDMLEETITFDVSESAK